MNKYAVFGGITVFNNKLPHSAEPVTQAIWYPPHLFTTQLTNSTERSPSSDASSTSAKLEIPCTLETESSLTRSYDPASCSHPSPDQSNSRPPTLILSYLCLGFQSGSIHKENPTRCNSVSPFYFILIRSSTRFGRHTVHHQEP
jgi:hypothetical protein